jgi:transposase
MNPYSFRCTPCPSRGILVKQRRVVGILKDDRIATLEEFLSKILRDKVREVCIDMIHNLSSGWTTQIVMQFISPG